MKRGNMKSWKYLECGYMSRGAVTLSWVGERCGEAEVLCLIGQRGHSFSLGLFSITSVTNPLCYVLHWIRGLRTIYVFCGENEGCVFLGYWFPVGSGAIWISVLDWGSTLCCSSNVKSGRSQTQAGEFQHWPREKNKCPLKLWASPRHLSFLVLFFWVFSSICCLRNQAVYKYTSHK